MAAKSEFTTPLRTHERYIKALFTGLSQNQPQLRVVTAVVNEINIVALEFGDQCREVLVARSNTFKHLGFDAIGSQQILDGCGKAFTVLLFVVNNGQPLRFDVITDMRRRQAAPEDCPGRWCGKSAHIPFR